MAKNGDILDRFFEATNRHCTELRQQLGAIKEIFRDCGGNWNDLDAIAWSVQISEDTLHKLVNETPLAYLASPKIAPPALHTVFATPELLENILLQCEIISLLSVWGANKHFSNTIEGSVKIQRKLGLLADKDCDIYCPRNDQSLLSIRSSVIAHRAYSEIFDQGGIDKFSQVLLTFHVNEFVPRTGIIAKPIAPASPRFRKMLICQPPITSINVYAGCCTYPSGYALWRVANPEETLTNDAGLTVDDVLQSYTRVFANHRNCPHTTVHKTGDDGTAKKLEVYFRADFEVSATEPLLVARKNMAKGEVLKRAEDNARFARLHAYKAGKEAGTHHFLLLHLLHS